MRSKAGIVVGVPGGELRVVRREHGVEAALEDLLHPPEVAGQLLQRPLAFDDAPGEGLVGEVTGEALHVCGLILETVHESPVCLVFRDLLRSCPASSARDATHWGRTLPEPMRPAGGGSIQALGLAPPAWRCENHVFSCRISLTHIGASS